MIYVDADACPVKAAFYRVAERHAQTVHIVANRPVALPRNPLVHRVVVDDALNAADDWFAGCAGRGPR